MLRPRRLVAASCCVISASIGVWSACSDEHPGPAADGGAEAGGAAGDGMAGTGGAGQGGGSGGLGGSKPDAGQWGAYPKWAAFPGSAIGCTFERLVNAAEVRVFKWDPCDWTEGCDDASFNPNLLGSEIAITPTSTVVDDGATVRVGLIFEFGKNIALFATDDGNALDGLRVSPSSPPECHLFSASVWDTRFGVMVKLLGKQSYGGVLGDIGSFSSTPSAFGLSQPDWGSLEGPQRFILGTARWLWWWAPVHRFTTVSSKDGSKFVIFADTGTGPIVSYSGPTTTGPLFLAQEFEVLDGGHVQGKIAFSDGIAATKPYLVPEKTEDDYGSPAFANSHVGFFKGISQKSANGYETVEVWATPYSTSPNELKPELVAPYPFKSMNTLVGGWGRLGAPALLPPDNSNCVGIWTIATKAVRTYPVPQERELGSYLGVSRTHLWVGASKPATSGSAYLMRFNVD